MQNAEKTPFLPRRFGQTAESAETTRRPRATRGPVESSWTIEQDGLKLEIYVPVGTTATVYVPAGRAERVTESGHPASESPGVEFLRTEDRAAVFAVGSGRYQFAVK